MKYTIQKLFLLLFCCFCNMLAAQNEEENKPDPQLTRAEGYIKRAEEFYVQAKYEASIKEYQFAATIYRKLNRPELYGISYNGVGNNYINMTRYKEAFTEFKRVTALYDEMAARQKDLKLDSTIIADCYEGFGRYYMNVDVDFAKALDYHEKALRLRSEYGKDESKVALSYFNIGLSYRGFAVDSVKFSKTTKIEVQNPFLLELEYLEKALSIQQRTVGENHHQTADTYEAIGNYFYEIKSDYQKGFEYHQKALSIRTKVFREDHPKIAASYLNMAAYYRIMGLYDAEQEYLEKALNLQIKILGSEHKDIAKSYYLLGNRNYFSGDYEKALDYFDRALAIYKILQGESSVEIADVTKQIALCYRGLDDTKLQYKNLMATLDVQRKIYGRNHYKLGETYLEIGTYYGANQQFDSLLYYYQKASDLWIAQLGIDHFYVAKAYDYLAIAHRMRGEFEKEIYYLNEALAKKQKSKGIVKKEDTYSRDNQDADLAFETKQEQDVVQGARLFDSYMNLAYFYKKNKDYRLALIYVQNALTAVCNGLSFDKVDVYQNPNISELSHNIEWLLALQEKGELALNLYYASKDKKELDFSLKTYKEALALIDTLRINFTSDGSKQQLTNRSIPVFEGAIEALHTMYQNTKNPKFMYEAFEVMEHSKGFVLLQALQGIAARNFSGVPAELLAKEEYLRQNLAYYSDFKNRGKTKEKDFDGIYFKTRQAYDSLIHTIETKYPKYYAIKYQNKVASIKQVQAVLLNSQNLLIEYFVGNRHIYVFKITADYQYFYKVPVPADFERMVTSLRNSLTDYQLIAKDTKVAYKNYTIAANAFYKTFVQQFLSGTDKGIKQLIIVPDGGLTYIPFEVLLEELPKDFNDVDYANLSYLLKRYEINYSYSATLLLQNMQSARPRNNGRCLGFAPTYKFSKSMGADAELTWTAKELEAIKKSFKGDYYIGVDATKELFEKESANYGVIHLAMHGIVNMRNPLKSFLAFSKTSEEMEEEEAQLYAYEVHNLTLKADLVVLSACETGFGKVVRGEGVLSLARAFMYAGVPSIVTTLWKVNDYTSAALMSYFYKNLAKGMSKPEALRQAKLTYLKQSDDVSGHPAFWGSFITIGNPSPVQYGFPVWVWITLILSGLVLIAFLIGMWLTRRSRAFHKKQQNDLTTNYKSAAGMDNEL